MTNSRKTTVKIFVIVLALLALVTTLVACNKIGPAHYDYLVTFNYNVGNIEANAPDQQIGLLGENPLVQIWPGYTNSIVDLKEHTVRGYYIEGWYLPESFNEDGTPVTDENGFIVLGDKWDFKNNRVSESFTLYAKLKKKPRVNYIDRATGAIIDDDNSKIECLPGDYVSGPINAPAVRGKTFLGKYYKAQTGEEEFEWGFNIGETDVNVYVSFIDGEWRFVNTAAEFITAIQANRNIRLEKDLDFKNNRLWSLGTYNGLINGQNHTISNISRDFTASRNDTANFGGIFGTLGASAHIYDIKFKNINVSFSVNSSYQNIDAYVGLLAYGAEEGAKLTNVTVDGVLSYKPDETHPITADKLVGKDKNKATITNCQDSGVTVIEGDWKLVASEAEFIDGIRRNRNMYLTADLDFASYASNALWSTAAYSAEIAGNDHSVSNVTRNIVANRNVRDNFGGIFGTLGANANIHDISFVNVKATFTIDGTFNGTDVNVGLLACRAEEGARLTDVTIVGSLEYRPDATHTINTSAWIADDKTLNTDIVGCDYSQVTVTEIENNNNN